MTPQGDGLTAPRMLRSPIYIMLPPVCLIILDIHSCIVDLVYICTETPPFTAQFLGIVNSLQWLGVRFGGCQFTAKFGVACESSQLTVKYMAAKGSGQPCRIVEVGVAKYAVGQEDAAAT